MNHMVDIAGGAVDHGGEGGGAGDASAAEVDPSLIWPSPCLRQ